MTAGVRDVAEQHHEAAEQNAQRNVARQYPLAKQFQPGRDQHQAQAEQHKAKEVEAALGRGEVRHVFTRIEDAEQADRDIDQKIQCQVA